MAEEDGKTGTTDAGTSQAADTTDWKAEAEKWKALSRKHEDQAKANKTELDKLKADGDASKSELQKLEERIASAEKRAEAAELAQRRAEVAQAKGLTPAQAKRLQGTTVEELESDADDLLASFKPADKADDKPGTGGTGKPKESLRPGAAATDAGPEEDAAKVAERILAQTR
jgi:septal ring factor EnvC (AmiA/AmiB activator)